MKMLGLLQDNYSRHSTNMSNKTSQRVFSVQPRRETFIIPLLQSLGNVTCLLKWRCVGRWLTDLWNIQEWYGRTEKRLCVCDPLSFPPHGQPVCPNARMFTQTPKTSLTEKEIKTKVGIHIHQWLFYGDITLVECVDKKRGPPKKTNPPTFWVGLSESRAVKLNLFINSLGRVPQIKPNSAQPPWSPAGRPRPALCVLGVKLFNSLPLNLFTNDLVRGNTYQLPVSANKPPAHLSFLFFSRRVCTVGRDSSLQTVLLTARQSTCQRRLIHWTFFSKSDICQRGLHEATGQINHFLNLTSFPHHQIYPTPHSALSCLWKILETNEISLETRWTEELKQSHSSTRENVHLYLDK